jgi:hypothetical protein
MRATNFTVTMALLVAFTIFIAVVRSKKPLENNWPLLYWILVVFFAFVRPEESFNPTYLLIGLGCGLLLRFEFMNSIFIRIIRTVEFAVMLYVVCRGIQIIARY